MIPTRKERKVLGQICWNASFFLIYFILWCQVISWNNLNEIVEITTAGAFSFFCSNFMICMFWWLCVWRGAKWKSIGYYKKNIMCLSSVMTLPICYQQNCIEWKYKFASLPLLDSNKLNLVIFLLFFPVLNLYINNCCAFLLYFSI